MIHTQDELDWRDLQIALAFHEYEDLSLTAKHLRMSTSTVQRRIQALEHALGIPLCQRSTQGTKLTSAARDALGKALEMRELAHHFLSDLRHATHDEMTGRLNITLPSGLVAPFCAHLPSFRARFPNLELRLIESNAMLDLREDQLDLAIRITRSPSGELWGRQLGSIDFALHAARAHLGALHASASLPWITFDPLGHASPQSRWEQAHVPESQVVLRTSSRHAFIAALRAGVGVGIMATLDAAQYEDIVQIEPVLEDLSLELWLLAHQSQRKDARLRPLMDALEELARAHM